MLRTTSRIFALFALLSIAVATVARASGIGISLTEYPPGSPSNNTDPFTPYQPRNLFPIQIAHRDLEFLWDAQYPFIDQRTLDSLGSTLAVRIKNPWNIQAPDIQLVHDMLSPTNSTYNTNLNLPGFLLADKSYATVDRQQVDYYLYVNHHDSRTGGQTNSYFRAAKEDSSTGHWQSDIQFDVLYKNLL